ncbi:hypothetical protein PPL_06125 [Heterostelium album PN500]|uniref:Minichromosome loss protein Mcl1 middle region domain-containing protein n=1 Tax=Heterostelium pallidum (strain ATCC 26659 / Pp 5 / PN500) TaxID=670386 RepID=D3BCA0_HETP5|nr:hypothetical protein PPL_06125 [Heterostelium album PN500]EFA80890.1 hypothetical protein PPL_06125 [Heterostelium album PN500]|eukprot:XP_020433009.1 hypothetical protein PPL_06125 [Heterostelium album PN500]
MSGKSKVLVVFPSQPESNKSLILFHPIKVSYLISCSSNSNDIKIYNVVNEKSTDLAPVEVKSHHSSPVTSVAISPKGDYLASSSLDKTIVLFTSESLSKQTQESKTITFSNVITYVTFSPTGSYLAAATNDNIRLINMMDHSQIITFKAHDGMIQSINYSPNGNYLVSIGSDDGMLKIWSISQVSEDSVEPVFEMELSSNGGDAAKTMVSWKPDSTALSYTESQTVVSLTEKDGWQNNTVFEQNGHTRDTNGVAWSPNGKYLASSGQDKYIMIWDPVSLETVNDFKHQNNICNLSWRNDGNCLAFIDSKGQIGVCWNIIPSNLASPTAGAVKSNSQMLSEMFDSPDVAEADDTPSKSNKKKKSSSQDIDLEVEEELSDFDMDDDFIDDEEQQPQTTSKKMDKKSLVSSLSKSSYSSVYKSFQPGSTYGERKPRYFLALNMIGMIIKREDESSSKSGGSIEIEFNEVSFHRKITFIDNNQFDLASLGKSGAVFASTKVPTLYFKPFDSIGQNSDWSYQVSENDKVIGVSIGSKYIVACTKQRTLRIFTLSGLQLTVMSLCGDLITMSQSFDDRLAVVYSNGGSLRVLYLNLNDGNQIYHSDLAISPVSTLTWIGFSDANDGQLTTVDSNGIVRGLMSLWPTKNSPLQWSPIKDLKSVSKTSSSVTYWVVGLNDKSIYCILCENQPQTVPRPSLSPIPISPILLTPENPNNLSLEENFYKAKQAFSNFVQTDQFENNETLTKQQTLFDSDILRLFKNSLEDGNVQRCYELCQLLQFKKSLSIAIKLANDKKSIAISSKIVTIMDKFNVTAAPTPSNSLPSSQTTVTSQETKSTVIEVESPKQKSNTTSPKISSSSSSSSSSSGLSKLLSANTSTSSTTATKKKSVLPFPKVEVGKDNKKRKDIDEADGKPLKQAKK